MRQLLSLRTLLLSKFYMSGTRRQFGQLRGYMLPDWIRLWHNPKHHMRCLSTQRNIASRKPDAQYRETLALPKCGDRCCPPGYTCKSGMCFRDVLANTKPRPSSSTTTSNTATSGSSSSSLLPASTSQAPRPPTTPTPNSIDVKVVTLGSILGAVLFLALIALGIFLARRRGLLLWKRAEGDKASHQGSELWWDKPELQDTQPGKWEATPVEVIVKRNTTELEAEQLVFELPG
ncbi:hypothetical protein CC86DRAFT_143659 [Ophiobolus disseminans]|uniref:Uncharacterized protein n=1 Tax=Ophiobolus disseminans TaxID=1469910 RepID=A0A6A7AGT6_9PLEO|nr:hypothetical protein CC86DRAFT_143659 [Ophiobolus disseminans]